MRTIVYIDAFNFYFGAVKGTPYKWLDFGKLCSLLLPNNQITHLLCDGFRNNFEVAVLLTGDSDLLAPLRVVKEEIGKPIGVINPQSRPCRVLFNHASFYRQAVRPGVLAASQFPATMADANGTFRKPASW